MYEWKITDNGEVWIKRATCGDCTAWRRAEGKQGYYQGTLGVCGDLFKGRLHNSIEATICPFYTKREEECDEKVKAN